MRLITCLLLFIFINGHAQIPQKVTQEIDLRVKHQLNTAIVVGVYEDGATHFYTQGWQDEAKMKPISINSIFEIGSISKTFTGLLLAVMAEQFNFTIDDPVQAHWPQPFKLQDQTGQTITFKHLATHTSGLPRLPSNLSLFSSDPYADYDRNELINAVMQVTPQEAGIRYAYSNFAAGLLGESMAVIGKNSYNNLVFEHILKPLNLTQTYMTIEDVPTEHLTQGYVGNRATNAWNFKALAGAGSIRSSIQDLLAYGTAYLTVKDQQLAAAMARATATHYSNNNDQVGLGWHVTKSGMLWHNGATGGFSSILLIDQKQQKVVAALTNNSISEKNNIEDMALHLMDSSRTMRNNEFPIEISHSELGEFLGNYIKAESGQKITLSVKSDQLYFDAKNITQQSLAYIGGDTFKFDLIQVKVKFSRDQNDNIIALILEGWGAPQIFNKEAN